jgi:hypothetical protein
MCNRYGLSGASCLQIEYKGQRVIGQVTTYDIRKARHEVNWRSIADGNEGKQGKAWVDFCHDTVYGEYTGITSGDVQAE